MSAPAEITWQLEVIPPQHSGQPYVEKLVGEWAHLSHTTPPAVEADPLPAASDWPAYLVTVPGGRDAPPVWLKSLSNYLWGSGCHCRITNDVDYYTEDGLRWRKHDVHGGPHDEPPQED